MSSCTGESGWTTTRREKREGVKKGLEAGRLLGSSEPRPVASREDEASESSSEQMLPLNESSSLCDAESISDEEEERQSASDILIDDRCPL